MKVESPDDGSSKKRESKTFGYGGILFYFKQSMDETYAGSSKEGSGDS